MEDSGKLLRDGAFVRDDAVERALGELGCRNDGTAQGLGQGADELGEQLQAQTWDQPIEALGVKTREQRDGHHEGDAIERIARFKLVREVVVDRPLEPAVRECFLRDAGVVFHELRGIEVEEVGVLLALLLPPGVEMAAGRNLCGQARVVEVEEPVLVDHESAAACLLLVFGGVFQGLRVLLKECVVRVPVASDEGLADEHVARGYRIDAVVGHEAVVEDGNAVERRLLMCHGGSAFARPRGLRIMALEQISAELFHPGGIDGGDVAGPEAGGLHELGGHEELRRLLRECGAGEDEEARVARTLEFLGVAVARADVGQQAGQQGHVDTVIIPGGGLIKLPAQLLCHVTQLAHQVEPLADAHVVEVFLLHALAEGVAGLFITGFHDVVPQLEHRQEIGLLVLEAGVGLVGLGLEFGGAFAYVLDGHGGDDDDDVLEAAGGVGFDEHAGHARIDGDARKVAADWGEDGQAVFLLVLESGELVQEE